MPGHLLALSEEQRLHINSKGVYETLVELNGLDKMNLFIYLFMVYFCFVTYDIQ